MRIVDSKWLALLEALIAKHLIRINYVTTADLPTLFVGSAEVSGRVYYVSMSIIWYVTFLTMSLRWPVAPPPNMIGTYW